MVKILAINGSHRKGKNTWSLLAAVLEGAKEMGASTELIELVDYNIKPCQGCNCCLKKPQCSITDDDMGFLGKKLLEADGIVFGSPVYFANVSGLMKIFMDRTRWLYLAKNMLSGKVGAAVTNAALRNGGQELAHIILERFITMHGMILASSRDPVGQVYNGGAMGSLFQAMERSGPMQWRRSVEEDEVAIRECHQLGRNVVRLAERVTPFRTS
ncbi:Multimeric flavodoxin WrbA [Thermanaeromonas toyohensis ToBE]|uniref:Multimeric flavodoxin WrbA n=1 Tax=Thermanaeromonas toyohensis ToBE TaxID=698762 RepID=A0A1W1W139_9FIRM|nr:flavodoxin family protein [Thermanaeromonas toyohensis]SMB99200.1 Multimeric flavodoxin WrbA [Thermanaeromonas toyohensis ToBE]